MSKKKLVAGLLASASVLGICLSGGTALAANVQEEDTTVGIGFKDHDNPEPKGDLSIQWLPKSFAFGDANDVNLVTHSFPLKDTSEKYVVVNDARADDPVSDEWKLSAKLGKLTSADGHRLTGAKLSFNNEVKAYDGGTAHPDTTNVVAARTEHTAVAIATTTIDEDGTAQEVMQDNGKGGGHSFKGKTATQLSGMALEIPGSRAVEKQSYTGKVTWSLDDTI
ncbi:WxL domain-containing protein [Candidatus Enterococcus murrayae]|uniref:WxL domain-containing protein n=1 Tax=Candidatus Enterococcus murrayae TaxID=2815321 RepID=A0ABS3HCK9_9ENTE|nr:WxL domain-containing protein [Enterococcus sp. MJM16]MBO0451183.1 WxL domain-containing protein [Enterococcus sp. MJM16]